MYAYVIMKGTDVFGVTETLDQAMELVQEERYRIEGEDMVEHAWKPWSAPHKGHGTRPLWQAMVATRGGQVSAGYGIFRWPVQGTR